MDKQNPFPKDWALPRFETHEFAQKLHQYCICIPVINEGEKIRKQLREMRDLAKQYDVIICDGGSTDGSLPPDFLKSCGVRTLLIKRDSGKLSAQLRMGYAYALQQGYEGIITIDGNHKDDPAAIPHFVERLEQGYDFVQGSRFILGGKAINTPLSRLLAIKLIHTPAISLIARKRFSDTTNGFRGYSRNYLLHPKVQPFREIFATYELLAYLSVRASQLGLKVTEIPVTRRYPKGGRVPTKISPIKGYYTLIKILVLLTLHRYNPRTSLR